MKLEATLKTPFKIVTHGVVFKQGKKVSEHTFVQDTFKIYMFAQLYKLQVGRQHTLKKITINTIQVHKYVDQIILVAGRKIYYLQKKREKCTLILSSGIFFRWRGYFILLSFFFN